MRSNLQLDVVLAGLLVAAAIMYHAETGRYEFEYGNGGTVVLDTRTRDVFYCRRGKAEGSFAT